jgi:hypothetical protein
VLRLVASGALRSLRAPSSPQDGKRVPSEEPIPLCFVRRFPPYYEFPERRDARGRGGDPGSALRD